jgi:hypothetical protein
VPSQKITVCKRDHLITGDLVALDDDNVTLIADQKLIVIREYDRIRMEQPVPATSAYISLPPPLNPWQLSFLLPKITWKCVGTALIDLNNETLLLRLTGQISNLTDQTFEGIVTLVSGSQNSPIESGPRLMRAMAVPDPNEAEPLADYVRYDIGAQRVGSNTHAELGLISMPVSKIYFHDTETRDRVTFGYRCAPQRYLPQAVISIYSMGGDGGIDAYLGATAIPESRFRTDLDLMVGRTTTLQCTSLIQRAESLVTNPLDYGVKSSDQKWHLVTQTVQTQVRNFNRGATLLQLAHRIDQERIINITGSPFINRSPTHLEWIFQIPPAATEGEPYVTKFEVTIVTLVPI